MDAALVKKWGSPSLGEEMSLNIYGSGGTPVLAFPDFNGKPSEYKSKGYLKLLEEQLENRYNRFYCVGSVDAEVFANGADYPEGRLHRYIQYENYIVDEVIPFIRDHSENDYLIVAGVGFGAYHAMNLALKHPGLVNKVLAACGRYNIRPYFDGYFSDLLYYNNPSEYFPNLNDPQFIDQIKRLDIRLISCHFDPNKHEAEHLSDALNDKWIDHSLDMWETTKKCGASDFAKMLRNHIP
jgi:esterase/lipase superfamily enzyme